MCNPAVLLIAGAAVSAAGTVYGGMAAQAQGRYADQIAQRNAAMDRAASQDALQRGRIEEARQYRKNAQLQGAQRAAMAANGIETDYGSAMDLQTDTKKIGWQDANTIRENAVRESKGFEINAWNHLAEGQAARSQGNAALVGSLFNAGGTILSAASQAKKMKAG